MNTKRMSKLLPRALFLTLAMAVACSLSFGESLTTWLDRLPGGRLYLRSGKYIENDTTYSGMKFSTNVYTPWDVTAAGNRAVLGEHPSYRARTSGLEVSDTLALTSEVMDLVVSSDAITSIATPFISTSAYTVGTIVILTTDGTNDLTISDNDTTAGTLVELRGVTTRNIDTNDYLCLRLEKDERWHELWYSDASGDMSMAALTVTTLNTGQGANELYDMDQNVQTSDAVTFATVNTGQGAAECYLQNQNLRTTDAVTHKDVAATFGVTAGTSVVTGESKAGGFVNTTNVDSCVANGQTICRVIIATTVVDTFDYTPTEVNAKAGWGNISISGGLFGAQFTFTSAGAVSLNVSTGATTTNGNDDTLNIYDGGTGIVIENQAGGTATIMGELFYIN